MEDQNFDNGSNNYQDYTSNGQYQNPYQPQQEPPKQTNVLAIVGMILGIISILAGCCGWYSLFLGIPGIICSILARKQGKSGMATAGIVCSVIGIILGILMTVLAVAIVGIFSSIPEYQELLQYYGM
ncbi:MAG: DUF4190 domain-containing protein [Lachnospiraceae bacterium]|nr:DUF4190 domain-containing protein [Lachnospiraceae bacterium]